MAHIIDPFGNLKQPSIKLYAEKGHKVTVTEKSIKNGYDFDIENVNKYLKVGEIYTVEEMDVYDFHSTVLLQEIPNVYFNSVNFIDVD
ncbi:MAG: hypothetical protein IT275_11220 [Chitinophagales bacterium]|mgnify:CR=1 FL=1|nr:hypothetical protein [Chitinophagales bacterium]